MNANSFIKAAATLAIAALLCAPAAHADYQQRFALAAGIVTTPNPTQTSFEIGAEYEYRLLPILGIGALGNYIFSSPGIAYLGAPDVFFHPLEGEWIIHASPILELGSSVGTQAGVRVGTRFPIPFGAFSLVPSLAVDFIQGGENYWYGLGILF